MNSIAKIIGQSIALLLIYQLAWTQRTDLGLLTAKDSSILQEMERTTDPVAFHQLVVKLIMLSDDKSALPLLEESRYLNLMAQKRKDIYLEAVSLSMYGQSYRITGNFAKALEYHYKAIELSKQQPEVSLVGLTINQSAHMYKDREENEKAVSLYREALTYAQKGKDSIFLFYPNMNLGFVYLNKNQPDSALYFSTAGLEILRHIMSNLDPEMLEIVERSLEAYCLSNVAGAYSKLGNKVKADLYYAEATKIMKRYPQTKSRYFQFVFFSQAKHYQRYNLTDSSLIAAKKAVESVLGSPFEYLSAGPAKLLSDYYENHNSDSAVKYLKIYLRGNDIMNNTRVTQQLQSLSFEEEQKQQELERAEKLYRNRIMLYCLVAGMLVLTLIAVFIFRSSQQRKRINSKLQEQKEQLENTLTELKSTQSQLIQSEKMASLGELTAGIAHEIQNPLNFVNNFSEVNKELAEELESELKSGNSGPAIDIARDIRENSEKINHHGKRAEGIVKGMLQHSRSSSGQKEPTDINALCDEYLRLAYHGFRAKDKSFHANFATEFDPSVAKIELVPQDVGRVILNLVNNAFYSVNEKAKTMPDGYSPLVKISTRRLGAKIEILVADNGNGIPEKIREKIFQPFFTTKPTGQGTGLGLSLSYDIVKAHGGEFTVDTKEGEGTCFVIALHY